MRAALPRGKSSEGRPAAPLLLFGPPGLVGVGFGASAVARPGPDSDLAARTIHEAWERFGGSETTFQSLTQLMRLCDTHFTAKHVSSIYALSRRPVADCRQVARLGRGARGGDSAQAGRLDFGHFQVAFRGNFRET